MEYATLSEMVYYATREAEIKRRKGNKAAMKNVKFDLSFLIDIALDNKDQALFEWCLENDK